MRSTTELLAPTYSWMPEFGETLGPEVVEVAELAGFVPDPEQRLALDWTFALKSGGKVAVRDVAMCAPRQNLKTGFLKMCALGWLYVTEQRLIVWSAHEFPTAQESFRDMCQLIEDCPDLDAEVKQIHRGNGDEAIELRGDRRLRFKARTKSGGRGLTGDKVVLDEAMFLTPTHMGALLPTLRAVPDPQLVLAGSAGLLSSDVWRGYRDRGRGGDDRSLAWLEWADTTPGGCEDPACDHRYGRPGCCLDDPARWWSCNTALGRRISEETLEADRRSMDAAEFARETLGWWSDPDSGGGVLDPEVWKKLAVGTRIPERPVLAVEVGLDREHALIAAAWRIDGKAHVEIVEERTGAAWVADRLVELRDRYGTPLVVLDAGTEAVSLAPALEDAGIEALLLTGSKRAAACGLFVDAVTSGAVSHNGDPAVADALSAARWKAVGEGARVFSRRGSGGNIAALYAVALAFYGLGSVPAECDFFLI